MNERTNRNRRSRRRRTRRVGLIITIVVLSAVLCALLGWVYLMQRPEAQLQLEVGSPLPQAADFLPEKSDVAFMDDISGISMNVPGTHSIRLSCGMMRYTAKLIVADTVAPAATAKDATILVPNTVTAEDMVTDIQDATDVTVSFAKQPNMNEPGEHTVTLVLTDLGGNTTELNAKLTVLKDTQAPVISGVKSILVYQGGTVAYRSGITVTDDYDENVVLTPDSSAVDLSTPGTYKLTYSATDASGNTATEETTVTVMEKRPNQVELDVIYAAVDKVLAKFITDDMTDREKVEAIYVWSRTHFRYGGHTDTTDYVQSAYQFLKSGTGDCFGYSALLKLMLGRLNIPTMDVKKVKNYATDSNHYWQLVSVDGGKTWYHCDTTPRRGDGDDFCLVTDSFLDAYSNAHNKSHNRDKSLYPATPSEALPKSTLPWSNSKILKARP